MEEKKGEKKKTDKKEQSTFVSYTTVGSLTAGLAAQACPQVYFLDLENVNRCGKLQFNSIHVHQIPKCKFGSCLQYPKFRSYALNCYGYTDLQGL